MKKFWSKMFSCNGGFAPLTLLAAFVLMPLVSSAATHVDSLLECLHNPKSDYVFVIAHRADWRGAPENSVQGIENAIRMGVDMVEVDIQRTRDGRSTARRPARDALPTTRSPNSASSACAAAMA